jgi:hypothetical protein
MQTSTYCILVIIAFFAFLFHAIRTEEKRCGERRRQDLPHPVDRRGPDRRRPQSWIGRAGWALRSRWGRQRQ